MVFHCCFRSHLFYTKKKTLQLQIIVKVHGVFPSNCKQFASSRTPQIHQAYTGDSGEIITPFIAVYWSLILMPQHLYVTFQHRAGVSLYTSFLKFAKTCVFVKQLFLPLQCQLIRVSPNTSLLIPKLQSQFAEFLQYTYLERLSIFYPST